MEPIKHSEWIFGVFLLYFAFNPTQLSLINVIQILIGTQLPDLFDLVLEKLLRTRHRRIISHQFLLWGILFLFSLYFSPILLYFFLATVLHLIVDLFSGCEPLYIGFQPVIIIKIHMRKNFGSYVERWGRKYIATNDTPTNADLAWFWVMQLSGTLLFCISFIIYLYLTT